MGEFVDTALSFPAVLFSFLLVVVVGYWALVLLGGAGLDVLDADDPTGAGHDAGRLAGLGLGGVPVTVAASPLIAIAWFMSLAGTALLGRRDPPRRGSRSRRPPPAWPGCAERLAVFGGAELRLIGTERIRTENNCVPRDIVPAGGLMLFGYNVFIGLKPETSVDDVFSLHRFVRDGETFRFEDVGGGGLPGLLRDPVFQRDFGELYRYYRETRLLQVRHVDGRLLAVFQTGPRTEDVRVLRWNVAPDGAVSYVDNRGERGHVFPPSHDFEWTETTRDDHVPGRHPHISIGGEVFVETVGGDLTIKIENNTETGEGIYRAPVDEPLQSLADADVQHARIGPLILLRIKPYKEIGWRHLVQHQDQDGRAPRRHRAGLPDASLRTRGSSSPAAELRGTMTAAQSERWAEVNP
jgi:hypothetical protein